MVFLRRQPVVLQYPPLTPLATYLGNDTTTRGSWHGVYGASGYIVAEPTTSGTASLPSGWSWGITGQLFFDYTTYNVAADEPNVPAGGSGFTTTWYQSSPSTFAITITQPGVTPWHMAFYLAQGDSSLNNRTQDLTIEDPNNNVLDGPRTFSNFSPGIWAKYYIVGGIKIIVTPDAPVNSGIALVVTIDP